MRLLFNLFRKPENRKDKDGFTQKEIQEFSGNMKQNRKKFEKEYGKNFGKMPKGTKKYEIKCIKCGLTIFTDEPNNSRYCFRCKNEEAQFKKKL